MAEQFGFQKSFRQGRKVYRVERSKKVGCKPARLFVERYEARKPNRPCNEFFSRARGTAYQGCDIGHSAVKRPLVAKHIVRKDGFPHASP